MNSNLPKEWIWVKLEDVCIKIGDIDHKMPKQLLAGYPYVSTKDFTEDLKISFDNAKYISKEDYLNLSRKIKPEKGDIIFPRYGTIGKNILIDFDKEFLVSYSCAVIKPNHTLVLSKYVYLYSLSPKIGKEIQKYTVETTQANVGIASIKSFVFPFPPINTQQAIVSKIEELFSELDKGTENLRLAQQQLKTYRQSVLKWAFEGRLTNENLKEGELPEGWKTIRLKELIEKIRSGSAVPPSNEISKYPILRSSSVRSGKINLNDIKYVQQLDKIKKEDYVESGDLLFTRLNGSVEYVGNCAKVPNVFPVNLLYPDRIFRLRLLNPEYGSYIMHFFASNSARKEIEANAKSTAGHMRISTPDITDMVIPLCSVKEQQEIVQSIETRLSVADKMEESINQSLQQAEALRQSILKKAFEGKLITQN